MVRSYSDLSASTVVMRAARSAGYKPAPMPTNVASASANTRQFCRNNDQLAADLRHVHRQEDDPAALIALRQAADRLIDQVLDEIGNT